MDYDRINRASNLVSKSPNFRRNIKYNMQQEIAEQKYRDYQFEKQNEARQNTLKSIQEVEALARTYARRDKDRARMEQIYGEAAENFKDIIQNKYGGDITRFWYEGGQGELEIFKQTVLGSEEALRMKKNTEEFVKYFDAVKKGGIKAVFNKTSEDAAAYAAGMLDNFKMPLADKLPYEEPNQSYYNSMTPGTSRLDAYIAYGNNENTFRINFANENNLLPEEGYNASYDDIRTYAAGYVGGETGGPKGTGNVSRLIGGKDSLLANSIVQVFDENFGQIDGGQIPSTERNDKSFAAGVKRLGQLAQQSGSQLNENPIYGNSAFNDYLPEVIKIFLDSGYDTDRSLEEGDVQLEGKKVNHTDGYWFGNNGLLMIEGSELEGNDWEMQGVTLSYRTIGDEPKLLTKAEVESGDYQGQKVVPVYVANLIRESIFGDEFISKELNFSNPLKAQSINDAIKFDNASYTQNLNKQSEYIEETKIDSFDNISKNSSASRLYDFALYNNDVINEQFKKLDVESPSLATRSLMLAFSQLFDIETSDLHKAFAFYNQPDIYRAIKADDPQMFIENYSDLAKQSGMSEENVDLQVKELAELAASIRNSIISQQK